MFAFACNLRRGMVAALLVLAPLAWAGSLDATARAEIDYLFGYLEKSGCEFNRNGSWYQAVEASKHLHDKYEYLQGKGLLGSTEQFIERAATESSMSGKAYQVRCGDAPAVKSADWFTQALAEYRKASHDTVSKAP